MLIISVLAHIPTETKENAGEPAGLGYLEYLARNIDIPFVAIGGITGEYY